MATNKETRTEAVNKTENWFQKIWNNRKKKALLVAILGFSAFNVHLYLVYGSFDFLFNQFKGDLITIANFLFLAFVLSGWYIVYSVFSKVS